MLQSSNSGMMIKSLCAGPCRQAGSRVFVVVFVAKLYLCIGVAFPSKGVVLCFVFLSHLEATHNKSSSSSASCCPAGLSQWSSELRTVPQCVVTENTGPLWEGQGWRVSFWGCVSTAGMGKLQPGGHVRPVKL